MLKILKKEIEVFDFIKSIYSGEIIRNLRINIDDGNKFVEFTEIDIFIPEFNLVIEYNGNFWHSEGKKDKYYHRDKNKFLRKKGFDVLFIYSHEWELKQDIIKSIIRNKLKIIENKYFARNLIFKKIDNNSLIEKFLNENHLQGNVNSKYKYGLFTKNNELISVITFGVNRFNKKEFELMRYSTKINSNVIGGFLKLLKNSLIDLKDKIDSTEKIISYCDLDHFNGSSYAKNGFKFEKFCEPSFFYFFKHIENKIYSRQQFQKHLLEKKLKIYNENNTAFENMKNNNFNRVWLSGNNKYELDLKNFLFD